MKKRTVFSVIICVISFLLIVLAICNMFINISNQSRIRTEYDLKLLVIAIIISSVSLAVAIALLIALIIRYKKTVKIEDEEIEQIDCNDENYE